MNTEAIHVFDAGAGLSSPRRAGTRSPNMEDARLHIKPLAPFRLDLTVWALRRQPNNTIDMWDGKTYTRVFVVDGAPLKVAVTSEGTPGDPRLAVAVSLRKGAVKHGIRRKVAALLEKMLGTNEDVSGYYRLARHDAQLSALANSFPGLKPPRFPTVFEALINAFACQQLSLSVGITLLNRLSATYGPSLSDNNSITLHAFPSPEDLAGASLSALRDLGFSRQKAQAIINVTWSVLDKTFDLEGIVAMADQDALDVLRQITGVGRWSAEYVLLRGLRRLNVFPGDDVGAQNSLQRYLSLNERPDSATVKQLMRRWTPYQGFVYFHLLLQKLKMKGLLDYGSAVHRTGSPYAT